MANKYLRKFNDYQSAVSGSKFIKFLQSNKKTMAVIVILAVILFFVYYLSANPDVIQNILSIGFINTLLIITLYGGVLITTFGIMYSTIRLCNKNLPIKNSFLLTIYSSIINFFGPLQSGPAVRAVYLKSKIGLRIRDYTYAMLFYYFAFAAINTSLLFINNLPWVSLLGLVLSVALTIVGTNLFGFGTFKKYVFYIFILAAAQTGLMALIYSVELNAVNPAENYSFLQSIVYTASANLALFVSFTPGAIGFREAFLILSQSLHNIPLASIIATGIIDRAVYIVFLVLLFLLSSSLHLKDTFKQKL